MGACERYQSAISQSHFYKVALVRAYRTTKIKLYPMTKKQALKFLRDTLPSDDYAEVVFALCPQDDCPHERTEHGEAEVCVNCHSIVDMVASK